MAPDDQDRGRGGVTPLRPQPASAAARSGEAWAVTVCAEPAATGTDRAVACAVSTGDADGGDVTYRLGVGLEHIELEVNLVLGDGMVWATPSSACPPSGRGQPAARPARELGIAGFATAS